MPGQAPAFHVASQTLQAFLPLNIKLSCASSPALAQSRFFLCAHPLPGQMPSFAYPSISLEAVRKPLCQRPLSDLIEALPSKTQIYVPAWGGAELLNVK